MIYVTRKESFCAAHRLFIEDLSLEENFNIFGKCSNFNWHGHNYVLYVTVKGDVDSKTGFLINLKNLSVLIKTTIVNELDHSNLNLDVPFLKNIIPTSENLTIAIWDRLCPLILNLGIRLHSIKIIETENNIVEYFG